jgi:hypothetical protein
MEAATGVILAGSAADAFSTTGVGLILIWKAGLDTIP